jgi:erythritol transport system permease protein
MISNSSMQNKEKMDSDVSAQKATKKGNDISIGMLALKMRTFIALLVLIVIFCFTAPNFTNLQSIILIAKHVSLYGLLGIGMTFVLITGGIDLSVGSVVGITAMISGGLIYQGFPLQMLGINIYFSIPIVIIISLIFGMIIGLISGLIITRFKVPAFIATLGMMYIARGFAMIRSNGATFPNLAGKASLGNTGFLWLGTGTILGIPVSVWLLVVFGILGTFILKKTALGWRIFAVGGNEKAAKLSGVKVNNVKLFVYIISGFFAALVGLIVASQLAAAQPASGTSWEMLAIAAAVLGGTSLYGGIGSVGGTIVGAFVIGVLNDGMVMCNISEFWQEVLMGAVIITAVIIDQVQRNLQNKMALQKKNA